MPFKSQAQRRFLYATNPKVAKKFSKHTPAGTKLPDRVKKAEALSTLMIASMRDEMSKIAGAMHTDRAKTAFAQSTKTLDTKPIDVNASAKQIKVTKNAGAPRGFRGPRVPTIAKGKRTDKPPISKL